MKNKLKVDPIVNGTVIDHITAGKALQVAEILNLNPSNELMMIGVNLTSKKMGKKDIIKIENRILTSNEANSIALISPSATLTIIKEFLVVEKHNISIPDEIFNHIICPNSNCVTNSEVMHTRFSVDNRLPVQISCCYCEKKYEIEEVKFKFI